MVNAFDLLTFLNLWAKLPVSREWKMMIVSSKSQIKTRSKLCSGSGEGFGRRPRPPFAFANIRIKQQINFVLSKAFSLIKHLHMQSYPFQLSIQINMNRIKHWWMGISILKSNQPFSWNKTTFPTIIGGWQGTSLIQILAFCSGSMKVKTCVRCDVYDDVVYYATLPHHILE